MKLTQSQNEVLSALQKLRADCAENGVFLEDIVLILRKRGSSVSQTLNRMAALGVIKSAGGKWFAVAADPKEKSDPNTVPAGPRQITSFQQAEQYEFKRMRPMRPGADDHLRCLSRRGDVLVQHTHIMPIGSRAFPDMLHRK